MKIKRPVLAVGIYLLIGFGLYMYGVRDGSLLIFDALAGIVVYKIVSVIE